MKITISNNYPTIKAPYKKRLFDKDYIRINFFIINDDPKKYDEINDGHAYNLIITNTTQLLLPNEDDSLAQLSIGNYNFYKVKANRKLRNDAISDKSEFFFFACLNENLRINQAKLKLAIDSLTKEIEDHSKNTNYINNPSELIELYDGNQEETIKQILELIYEYYLLENNLDAQNIIAFYHNNSKLQERFETPLNESDFLLIKEILKK